MLIVPLHFKMKFRKAIFATGILLIIHEVHASKFQKFNINDNCECGLSGEGISNRIVGGIISTPHIFPWIAAILLNNEMHCGGALINDRYILTAGHCVYRIKKKQLTVVLGKHDIKNKLEGFKSPVKKIFLHKDFTSDDLRDENDIALIKLKHRVRFDKNIKPVCLPHKGYDYANEEVIVSGWGRVTESGDASRYLRQAGLKVLPYKECRKTSFGKHLKRSMLCAYKDDTDACQGDSGGPLLFKRPSGRYETIGVVSWGIGCAERGNPGVYVKNTDYLNWIQSHTKDANYCKDNDLSVLERNLKLKN